ncbi:MAG: hypothetical protein KC506_03395 [Nanoarchaeota archaeon]|nr:hypothetical protein [Nanoarchaeota archaeon]
MERTTIIEAKKDPSYSGVMKILSQNTSASSPNEFKEIWCAWYSPQIRSNGWQPFDQPSQTSYLPLSYSELREVQLNKGSFLIQTKPSIKMHGLPLNKDSTSRHWTIPHLERKDLEKRLAGPLKYLGINANDLPLITQTIEEILE